MCGVVGIVLAGGAPVDRDDVKRMSDALVHRGPDGEGLFLGPGVGLGHRRLAIVDLSNASAQPMEGEPGHVLTFNGEIYNWKTLREELVKAGRTLRTSGDTEVLLRALETWGLAALGRLEGMFAFGYWDASRRTLLLARDRYGEKPLYYAPLGPEGRDGLVFASELRALVTHPRIRAERSIDGAAVAQFFLHEFVPAPATILRHVRKLPAGHTLSWADGRGVSVTRYDEPAYGSRPLRSTRADDAEATRDFVSLVSASTRLRLVADVPVGVFLSGGLDSSFLAACAVRVHPRVKTFTVAFEDPSFDESAHARVVASHLGTEHVEVRLETRSLLERVPALLDGMDEPFADSSLLPTTLLAQEARREVTVALGGEGGDELLAGYPTFVVDRFLAPLPRLPHALGRLVRMLAAQVPADDRNFSLSFKARQLSLGLDAETPARRHASWLAPLLPRELSALAGPRLTEAMLGHAFDAVDASTPPGSGAFDAATAFYLAVYLGEGVLTKVDRATMQASLEARAPLLDRAVVDFCLGLPVDQCLRGTTTKWLMRAAAASLLPESILKRPKKGFGAPVGAWLRGPLRELAEETLAPERVRQGGWLDPSAVTAMLRAHVAGKAELRKPLYAALVFERWRQSSGL